MLLHRASPMQSLCRRRERPNRASPQAAPNSLCLPPIPCGSGIGISEISRSFCTVGKYRTIPRQSKRRITIYSHVTRYEWKGLFANRRKRWEAPKKSARMSLKCCPLWWRIFLSQHFFSFILSIFILNCDCLILTFFIFPPVRNESKGKITQHL